MGRGDLGGGASQINVTDAGAGADTLAGLAVGLALADSGAGSDAFGAAASLATSDSGTAADVLAQLLASLGIATAAPGPTLQGNIGAGLVVGDRGAGSDARATLRPVCRLPIAAAERMVRPSV